VHCACDLQPPVPVQRRKNGFCSLKRSEISERNGHKLRVIISIRDVLIVDKDAAAEKKDPDSLNLEEDLRGAYF